jgi:hypothetical protein
MKSFLIVVILLISTAAFGADYWPTEIGATFHYVGDNEGALDVVIQAGMQPNELVRRGDFVASWGGGWFESSTIIDENGDVFFVGIMRMSSGWIDPDMITLDPAMLMLDLPLTVGSVVNPDIMLGGYPDFVTVTVSGPETITVPAGTFETMVVEIDWMFNTYLPDETLWLHKELGPVKSEPYGWELTSFTGVVANEDLTFGDVKTLFR